jgi:uncharacterized protein DUF4231
MAVSEGAHPQRNGQRDRALRYAKGELARHRSAERWHRAFFVVFQVVTIVSAATATVLAVADPNDVPSVVRAIPAAIATLGAAVLAAFGFRNAWRRHLSAARNLTYEILKFETEVREYRETEPRPEPFGVDMFLERVDSISRAGHQEPEAVEAEPSGERSDLSEA